MASPEESRIPSGQLALIFLKFCEVVALKEKLSHTNLHKQADFSTVF